MAPRACFALFACAVRAALGLDVAEQDLPLLFIGVFTAPSGADSFSQRRADVRESWMRHPFVTSKNASVVVRFIMGETEGEGEDVAAGSNASSVANATRDGAANATRNAAANATRGAGSNVTRSLLEQSLQSEEAMHLDFVHLPVRDTYANLPAKTMRFFRWFASERRARFVMKVDDDTYPHLDSLVPLLQGVDTSGRPAYLGKLLWNAPVLRTGKWAEDPALYAEDHYPVYASGSGYILSTSIVAAIVEAHASGELRLLSNEDTSVGVAVNRTAPAGLSLSNVKASIVGCHAGDAFSMNLCPGEMRCMWARRGNASRDTCCRPSPEYGNSYVQSFLQVRRSVFGASASEEAAAACKQTFEA